MLRKATGSIPHEGGRRFAVGSPEYAVLSRWIAEGLKLACLQGKLPGIDLENITYYIGRETIIPREDVPGMWVWRETLFAFLQRNAERTAAFFGVPTGQVVEFGTEIEI